MRALSIVVLVIAVVVGPTLAAATAPAASPLQAETSSDRANPCVGTMTERPDEPTLISVQGTRLTPDGYEKTIAYAASYAPNGSFRWARNATANGKWWAYDVDPMDNGNVLFATTEDGNSTIGELDPRTNEYVWRQHFDGSGGAPVVEDAHDADLLNDHEMVIADKGQGHERLLVYNRTNESVAWEWRFDEHTDQFPRSGGGPPHDWTHLNDVDAVGEDLFMASVRNFDQVIFVNRSTGALEMTLGADDQSEILDEQHNPDYLRGPDGEHTALVADSLNDRVVEYAYDEATGEWERVWSVPGFDEPRDADRLPNGNTLVVDRMGHRTVEVTPEGEVVWEVYTPYEPYDVERGADSSQGPTMRERGVEGRHPAHGGAPFSTDDVEDCARATFRFASGNGDGVASWLDGGADADGDSGSDGPASGGSSSETRAWASGPVLIGGLVALVALAVGAVAYRRRV